MIGHSWTNPPPKQDLQILLESNLISRTNMSSHQPSFLFLPFFKSVFGLPISQVMQAFTDDQHLPTLHCPMAGTNPTQPFRWHKRPRPLSGRAGGGAFERHQASTRFLGFALFSIQWDLFFIPGSGWTVEDEHKRDTTMLVPPTTVFVLGSSWDMRSCCLLYTSPSPRDA